MAGGRDVTVRVRLSEDEAAKLDRDRGRLNRSAFIRLILADDHISTRRADRPARVHDVPPVQPLIYDADAKEAVPMVPAVITTRPQRHDGHDARRGALREERWQFGHRVRLYYCLEPGCKEDVT